MIILCSVWFKMQKKNSIVLIICWLVYTLSYIGKISYNTNIIQIESFYGVTHSQAGLVSTCFFFSYGLGQFINGIFCKKYNLKYLVFFVLLISSACNIFVSIICNFSFIKYLWFINGCALSTLWPSLIRFLSENTEERSTQKAAIIMGTSFTIGTIFCFCLSSLFVAMGNFKIIFYLSCIIDCLLAILWICFYDKLLLNKEERQEFQSEDITNKKTKKVTYLIPIIIVFSFFAIIANLLRDGLTTWVPMVLKELFGVPDSISILLTLVLPIVSAFGIFLAILSNKKSNNYIPLFSILFMITGVSILLMALFNNLGIVFLLINLAVVSFTMSGVCDILTSFVPLEWKKKINAGFIAGLLNGFCYVGSTISAYCLGLVADNYNWNAVFILLSILSFACVVCAIVYYIVYKIKKPAK